MENQKKGSTTNQRNKKTNKRRTPKETKRKINKGNERRILIKNPEWNHWVYRLASNFLPNLLFRFSVHHFKRFWTRITSRLTKKSQLLQHRNIQIRINNSIFVTHSIHPENKFLQQNQRIKLCNLPINSFFDYLYYRQLLTRQNVPHYIANKIFHNTFTLALHSNSSHSWNLHIHQTRTEKRTQTPILNRELTHLIINIPPRS